ncbi:hypothetical protein HK101_008842 [Irineochytrium annulatum]|nr:hypothetical protein HK101_008842 [Irineochytrium annulatum]
MADEIIFHQYHTSPYAQKITFALGLKGLKWRSVIVPNVPPRVTQTLTGGYRRIPVMQIGCDFYCDTALILDEIERRWPEKSLVPSSGIGKFGAEAAAMWCDKFMFLNVASLIPMELVPESFRNDRDRMMGRSKPRPIEEHKAARPYMREQAHSGFASLEESLAQSKTDQSTPTHIDLHALLPVWFTMSLPTEKPHFTAAQYPHIHAWYARLLLATGAAPGDKRPPQGALMTDAECTEVARSARSVLGGAQEGRRVRVIPNDYGKEGPVVGNLVEGAGADRVAVRRKGEDGVETVVHFPRRGYVVGEVREAKM